MSDPFTDGPDTRRARVLLGRAERVSVIVVFLGLLLWTWIWGAWGTLLAVPMLVVIKSIAERVESLQPVSRRMAP